jgi:hypothetical protein
LARMLNEASEDGTPPSLEPVSGATAGAGLPEDIVGEERPAPPDLELAARTAIALAGSGATVAAAVAAFAGTVRRRGPGGNTS